MNVNIYGGNLHNNPSDLILNSLGKKFTTVILFYD